MTKQGLNEHLKKILKVKVKILMYKDVSFTFITRLVASIILKGYKLFSPYRKLAKSFNNYYIFQYL